MTLADVPLPRTQTWRTPRARPSPDDRSPPLLIVPGINGSGPTHWQSHWEAALPDAERVHQQDWDHPRLPEWVAGLAEAVRRRPGAVLVAHSLGCALVAHWARITGGRGIAGALLVAPADVEGQASCCRDLAAFAPMPLDRLAFPSLVAASRDDPFVSLDRASGFANAWGSRFVDLGRQGHINVASGHGPWAEGLTLLHALIGEAETARKV